MRVLTGATPNDNISDADLAELYAPATDGPWLRVGMVSTVDGSATGDDARTASINNAADHRIFSTLRALAGAAIGTLVGMVMILLLPSADVGGGFLTGLGFRGWHWALPLAIPVLAALVAFAATRRAALVTLRELS